MEQNTLKKDVRDFRINMCFRVYIETGFSHIVFVILIIVILNYRYLN